MQKFFKIILKCSWALLNAVNIRKDIEMIEVHAVYRWKKNKEGEMLRQK